MWIVGLLWAVVLVSVSTAAPLLSVADQAAGEEVQDPGDSRRPVDRGPASEQGDPELAQALSEALDAALGEDGDLSDMHLMVGCLQDESFHTLEIFGRGIGIWHDEAQFTVGRDRLQEMLRGVRTADFPWMRKSYGGKKDPAPPAPDAQSAIKIICHVRLSLGGVEKGVFQLFGGRQHQPLWDLAGELFAGNEKAAAEGVRAADLGDGLRKVAAGELAPETFQLIFNRPAEPTSSFGGGEQADPTYLLRIEGRTTHSRPYAADGGLGEENSSALTSAELTDLATVLAESLVQDSPGNLYASTYIDLTVEVLGHEKGIQARRFAGMDSSTHGDAQARFETIVDVLDALYDRLSRSER